MEDGIEPADIVAGSAALAHLRVNHGDRAADEFVRLQRLRGQHQLQVGRVHVGIGQHGAHRRLALGGQVRERGRDAGLARAAFAAENDKLLHTFLRQALCLKDRQLAFYKLHPFDCQ